MKIWNRTLWKKSIQILRNASKIRGSVPYFDFCPLDMGTTETTEACRHTFRNMKFAVTFNRPSKPSGTFNFVGFWENYQNSCQNSFSSLNTIHSTRNLGYSMKTLLANLVTFLWSPYVIGRPYIFSSCLWPPYVIGGPLYFCPVVSFYLLSIFYLSFFSSPNLSGHRLDVYHTSTHGVALVRIQNAGLKCAVRGSLKIQDAKKSPKIAIWAPSHNFVGLYLRN